MLLYGNLNGTLNEWIIERSPSEAHVDSFGHQGSKKVLIIGVTFFRGTFHSIIPKKLFFSVRISFGVLK